MSFQIRITETRTVRKTLPTRWEKVAEKEVARDDQFVRDTEAPSTRIEVVMGYTPAAAGDVDETREVLVQSVDELDLAAVIKAINKL